MHTLSHPAMSSFVFYLKKLKTLRNNVIVSSLALHIRHLGSFLVPSTFALMLLVLMHWSRALVMSDSVSLCKWLFRDQFHDFMSAISPVSLMKWPWSLLSCFLLVCCLCLVIFGGSVTPCSPDGLHSAEMNLSDYSGYRLWVNVPYA